MRVAFVYVPLHHVPFAENLRVVDEDFGRLPPLSLAYAAAIAEKAGHEAVIIDANALGLDAGGTIERLRAARPDAVAFSVSTYLFHRNIEWMREIRSALGVPVVVGGINMRLYPRESMRHPEIDYGILHFGTRGFPALLQALDQGISPLGLPEVAARGRSNEVVLGEVDTSFDIYTELPFPARHLLPADRYFSFTSQRRNFTVLVTGTGCPFACRYCAISSVPRYRNPVRRALSEVDECVNRHGVHEIDFFDADFLHNPEWTREFCNGLIERRYDLEWSCRTRVDALDEETVALARRSGCVRMYVGIETRDKRALTRLRKRVDVDHVADALMRARKHGIQTLGFFMLGVPGETHRSAWRTILWSLRLPLDYAQFSRMIAKPGSGLERELKMAGTDYWADYVSGRSVSPRLPNRECSLEDAWIERYAKLAYLLYYYRPSKMAASLRGIRSRDEFVRKARTAVRMLIGFAEGERN